MLQRWRTFWLLGHAPIFSGWNLDTIHALYKSQSTNSGNIFLFQLHCGHAQLSFQCDESDESDHSWIWINLQSNLGFGNATHAPLRGKLEMSIKNLWKDPLRDVTPYDFVIRNGRNENWRISNWSVMIDEVEPDFASVLFSSVRFNFFLIFWETSRTGRSVGRQRGTTRGYVILQQWHRSNCLPRHAMLNFQADTSLPPHKF